MVNLTTHSYRIAGILFSSAFLIPIIINFIVNETVNVSIGIALILGLIMTYLGYNFNIRTFTLHPHKHPVPFLLLIICASINSTSLFLLIIGDKTFNLRKIIITFMIHVGSIYLIRLMQFFSMRAFLLPIGIAFIINGSVNFFIGASFVLGILIASFITFNFNFNVFRGNVLFTFICINSISSSTVLMVINYKAFNIYTLFIYAMSISLLRLTSFSFYY